MNKKRLSAKETKQSLDVEEQSSSILDNFFDTDAQSTTNLISTRPLTNSERFRLYNKDAIKPKIEPVEPTLPKSSNSYSPPRSGRPSSTPKPRFYEKKYEIERIEASRINKAGEVEYKIKWKGYPSTPEWWQTASTLDLEDDVFGEFHAREPDAPRPRSPTPTSSIPPEGGSPDPPDEEKQIIIGFASWRCRPNVLVGDSDPSQATSSTQLRASGIGRSQNSDQDRTSTQLPSSQLAVR